MLTSIDIDMHKCAAMLAGVACCSGHGFAIVLFHHHAATLAQHEGEKGLVIPFSRGKVVDCCVGDGLHVAGRVFTSAHTVCISEFLDPVRLPQRMKA